MPKKTRTKPGSDETSVATSSPAEEIAWEDDEHARLGEQLYAAWTAETPEPLQIAAAERALRKGFELRAGEMLDEGRFRLLQKVGQGAITSVWKARDRKTGGLAAVKVLHAHLAADKERVARFYDSARRASRLDHPGIAAVLRADGDDFGFRWCATAFADGGTLEQAVLAKKLATHEALQALLDAADALAHAHANGVLHRDLKPSNVLLWGDGSARVVDFDLLVDARAAGGGSVYAAPETMEPGRAPDVRSDVYSLAMVALFVLNGAALPFWVLRDPERLIKGLNVSDAVKSALREALDWDLDRRCASVQQLRDALLDDDALIADLAAAALLHGRHAVAAGHLRRRLAAGLPDEDAVQVRLSLARALLTTGEDAEAGDLLLEALSESRDANTADVLLMEIRALTARTDRWELLSAALGQRIDAGDPRRVELMIEVARIYEERVQDAEAARAAWALVLQDHARREQAREALTHLVRMAEAEKDWDGWTRHARDLHALLDGAERSALQHRIGRVYLDELRDQLNGLLWLERALASGHDAAGLAESLEDIRAARGEWQQAIALMREQARGQKPAKAVETLRRAAEIALYGYRQTDEAAALHEAILERRADDAASIRFLARWHSRSGRAEEALALYARLGAGTDTRLVGPASVPADPDAVADLVDQAELLLGLDRPEDAVAPLQQALGAAPGGHARGLELLMDTQLDLARPSEAGIAAQALAGALSGVAPQPGFVRALIIAAEAAWQQGDVSAASAAFQRVLDVDPTHRRAWWGASRVALAAAKDKESLPPWLTAAPARYSPQEALARLLAGLLEPASVESWLSGDAMGRQLLSTLPKGDLRSWFLFAAAVDVLERRKAIGPDLFRRLGEAFPGWSRRIDAVRRVWCEPAGDVQFPVAEAYRWPAVSFADFDAAHHREPMHADPVVLREHPMPSRPSLAAIRQETAWAALLHRDKPLPEAALAHPAEQPAARAPRPEVPRTGALVSEGLDGMVIPLEGDAVDVGSARLVRVGSWFYVTDPGGVVVDGRSVDEARLHGGETVLIDGVRYRWFVYDADAEPPRPEPQPVDEVIEAEDADDVEHTEPGESLFASEEEDVLPAQGEQRPIAVSRIPTPIEPAWSDLDEVSVSRTRAVVFFRDGDGERIVPFVGDQFVIGRRARDDIELEGGRGGPCILRRRDGEYYVDGDMGADQSERRILSGERFVTGGRIFEFRLLDEDGVALGGATPQPPEPPRTRPVLHYDDGSRNGRLVEMPRFPFTIGRGRDNDLQISVDPALSRMHCRIEKRGDAWFVVDNGSSRGTRLNGDPIDDARLEDGDSIQIGDTQFEFELTAAVDELAEDETDEGPSPAHVKKPSRDSLHVAEGLDKVRVTNQALGILMAAYDRSGGSGRGEAAIQLMVESAPKPYAPLFDGVRIRGDGLPPLVVLYNVATRPEADQRWVLSAGLLDLIDRAVSVAADALPGDAVDELLEQIVRVNYRDQLRITPVG